MRASKSADQKIARWLRWKIRFATQQIESHGGAVVYLYRFNSAAARRIGSRKSRGTPVLPRYTKASQPTHCFTKCATRGRTARVAENARAHRVDYGARVFVICNLIIFLLTFAVMPVVCTNSEWSHCHPSSLPTWKSTMICGACHLRADRVDARLLILAYGEKIDSLFHSRYKVQSQSNKLESLSCAREAIS